MSVGSPVRVVSIAAAVIVGALLTGTAPEARPAAVQGACPPSWVPTFGGEAGTGGDRVRALAAHDDGSGPALFVGGDFSSAGGVPAHGIAKWDGSTWSAVGDGVSNGAPTAVLALTAFDDGGGPALYAGGSFDTAGGVEVNHVAKWDGTSWSALGRGVRGTGGEEVFALAVYDDGAGLALYAGGDFTSAGDVSATHIAKWDGAQWSALGSGLAGGALSDVQALVAFDDGSGPALIAGGQFTTAGGTAANNLARWNGSSWSAVGNAVGGAVRALVVHDDGGGPALYVGGTFTSVNGVPANRIARWNGASWTGLGAGADDSVASLCVYDDGTGPALFAAGALTSAGGVAASRIAKWDGVNWTALGSGAEDYGYALAVFDDGHGPQLYDGGNFERAGGVFANRIARWNGTSWSALGAGGDWVSDVVYALLDDGSVPPVLYAGGAFRAAGNLEANGLAKWDGASWTSLGLGPRNAVYSLAMYDDGSGPALHASGSLPVTGAWIAKFDGASWIPLGAGTNGYVVALRVFDDGSGPALYVGGEFSTAGGVTRHDLARWNGASWSTVGSGLPGTGQVRDFEVFDDGSGPALFVGGTFPSAGGAPGSVVKWNGATWSSTGLGVNDDVLALAAFDGALYIGGSFTTVNGVPAKRVARWNGSSWSPVGGGTNGTVNDLIVHDDESGPALYAAGLFTTAGSVAANNLAKWNGTSWTALGGGTDRGVFSLASLADPDGPALYVGGLFESAIDSGDSYVAKWGCLDLAPSLACPTVVHRAEQPGSAPGEIVTFTVTAVDDHDPAPLVVCVPPSGSFFPQGTTLVTCTATDALGNQATCQFPVTVALKARQTR